jgi:outer membrane protein assembly factor BamB
MNALAPRRPLLAVPLLALGLAAAAASAGPPAPRRDWPMFGGGPARNLVNPFARGLPTDWNVEAKARKNVKWVAPLGAQTYGSVVVSGGKVFIGTNNGNPRNPRDRDPKTGRPLDLGVLLCLREADGKLLWQAVHEKLASGLVNDWPRDGLRSMPAVEGNRLYYVSNRCELICADTEGFRDGKNDGVRDEKRTGQTDADIVWRLDMVKELGVFPHNWSVCSPLVVGDLVFVVTGNGVDEDHINIPAPRAPSFLAVNKRTGKVVWQNNAPTVNLLKKGANVRQQRALGEVVMHGQWSSPAYAVVRGTPQVIFPGGDGWLRAFEPQTGKLLWKFDANPKAARGKARNHFLATPVVHDGKLYVGVGEDPEYGPGVGHLWCLDLDGRGDVSSELVVNGNVVRNPNSAVVWHFGGPTPVAVARKIGRQHLFSRTVSTCAVHDGLVYAADLDGFLHCLDAKTGKEL